MVGVELLFRLAGQFVMQLQNGSHYLPVNFIFICQPAPIVSKCPQVRQRLGVGKFDEIAVAEF